MDAIARPASANAAIRLVRNRAGAVAAAMRRREGLPASAPPRLQLPEDATRTRGSLVLAGCVNRHKAVRVPISEGADEQLIHDTEDPRVGADGEGEHAHGDNSESRRPPHAASRVTDVAADAVNQPG